jgi:hypothetical protein
MSRYDDLMFQYYQVLNNAWKDSVRQSSRQAIRMLIATKETQKLTPAVLDDLVETINVKLGEEFSSAVRQQTQTFIEKSFKYGLNDAQKEVRSKFGIGLYGVDEQRQTAIFGKQQSFWIGEHFNADLSQKFSDEVFKAIDRGYTMRQLTDVLKGQFSELTSKGRPYWQGLAEHTSLRIREFGRLRGYEKAGARGYILINPMDDRTSDICYALVSKGEVYPLEDALEVRDKLLAVEMKEGSLDKAREQIKSLAPWVSEKDVIYNDSDEPTGVSGAHTPFPPFHWKCRTETAIVM